MPTEAPSEATVSPEGLPRVHLWTSPLWTEALDHFARVTGLCVRAYDCQGQPVIPPVIGSSLASYLEEAGNFLEGGTLTVFEQTVVSQAFVTRQPATQRYAELLMVTALPISFAGQPAGAILLGWIPDRFAAPAHATALAQSLDLSSPEIARHLRHQRPYGRAQLRSACALMQILSESVLAKLAADALYRKALLMRDEFLSVISHELRTPLATLLLRVQAMQRSGRLSHPRDLKSLAVLERAVLTQEKLVDDLLDGSALLNGDFRLELNQVDLTDIAQEVLACFSHAAQEKKIDLALITHLSRARTRADYARIKQVIWNLVFNAIKFTPPGGAVTVRLTGSTDSILVAVEDTGKGISAEHLPHVFERFVQLRLAHHSANCGLGLGLAISKYIVDLHGGLLKVSSAGLHAGSTFVMVLRRQRRAPVMPLPSES